MGKFLNLSTVVLKKVRIKMGLFYDKNKVAIR